MDPVMAVSCRRRVCKENKLNVFFVYKHFLPSAADAFARENELNLTFFQLPLLSLLYEFKLI